MVSRVSTPTGVVAVTPVTRLPPLSVGDVIAMRVARHMTDGVMRLVSGNFQLDVAGQEMFPVGARVSLQVSRGPEGGVSYQVSAGADDVPGQGAAPPGSAVAREQAALQRLSGMAADLASRQDGLAPLFSGLSAAAAAPASAALPQPVAAAMAALFGLRLVADDKLDGARLKRAIATAAGAPKSEGGRGLPGVLKDLGDALRLFAKGGEGIAREGTPPAPPSLARHPQAQPSGRASLELMQALARGDLAVAALLLLGKSDAALARVRLSGLTSLKVLGDGAGDGSTFDRTLDLPFVFGSQTGVISLQIGRDDTPGHEGEGSHPAWRVRFGIDTGASGPVEAVVGLDGTRLFATLWAERGETASALAERLSELREMLAGSGLEVVELKVLPGLPGNPPAASGQYVNQVS
ncbi:flagellar hook-length control protein FliK [Stappia stellulata]|uniref:flagellar hook-length control protein FliK n=1 Tax=Stappia stellulata TaxID=71235 RepID=UPI001CD5101F|nr:flagellar hook-length control protein FliK [Stappia stellulata]MCA1241441.1 flagellar hook-length control protein FliK [Stappia stellulata]